MAKALAWLGVFGVTWHGVSQTALEIHGVTKAPGIEIQHGNWEVQVQDHTDSLFSEQTHYFVRSGT